ncbi:MAG: circadian clock KaiB family protein [Gemmataceae bacterium]
MNATERYVLKLYVTGKNALSERAIENLARICEEDLGGTFSMEVIDILERPQLAEDERIFATPAVVKELPPPLRQVVGDLSNTEKVLVGLDLRPVSRSRASKD